MSAYHGYIILKWDTTYIALSGCRGNCASEGWSDSLVKYDIILHLWAVFISHSTTQTISFNQHRSLVATFVASTVGGSD